jgi:hypothetical protein
MDQKKCLQEEHPVVHVEPYLVVAFLVDLLEAFLEAYRVDLSEAYQEDLVVEFLVGHLQDLLVLLHL